MENKINSKKVVIIVVSIILIIMFIILLKVGIDNAIVNNQMLSAINAVTVNDNVKLYSSTKQNKEISNLEIGTNAYILEKIIDKNGVELCKVKVGKKVGYILSENLNYYKKANMKKELMLDVSKFNLQNNFSSIGEFKAFILNNNIKYVYIRAGGRGYGEAGNFYTDSNFQEYADACEYLKIPFGVYFLEEAVTSEEIDEEINFIQEFLENNKYENNILPIALDIEKHAEKGRADDIWDTRYILVNEMIEKIQKKGKNVIVYSNANIANKYLSNINTQLWLAYYPNIDQKPKYWYSDTSEEGASNTNLISKMVAWQFTETGIKNTINEKIDLSIVYNDFFVTGSMNDIKNDISGKSKAVKKVFKLKDKKNNIDIFSIGGINNI